jgi:uncharacterized protein involved in exopolysaccharide biosynthesis
MTNQIPLNSSSIIEALENPDLPYGEVKRIRQQVQKDVELLRNRVKMLQTEEQRAMKKIAETKNKTKQILDLKNQNDMLFAK